MRKVGFIISPGYQPMGFAVTSPFEIANAQAAEPVYDIRMLSKHGGPVRTSLGFQVSTEPFSEEPYDNARYHSQDSAVRNSRLSDVPLLALRARNLFQNWA